MHHISFDGKTKNYLIPSKPASGAGRVFIAVLGPAGVVVQISVVEHTGTVPSDKRTNYHS